MEVPEVDQFIQNIFTNATQTPNYITSIPADVSNTNKLELSVHSPVSLDVYDQNGRHVGLSKIASSTPDGSFIDTQIPNSQYYQIGDDKYITIPNAANYTVKLQGQAQGSFTLDTETLSGDNVVSSSSFEDVPVSTSTEATLSISSSIPVASSTLSVDLNGDGKSDYVLKSDQSGDLNLYLQSIKNMITGLGLTSKIQDELFMKLDKLSAQYKSGKIKDVERKIKEYIYRLKKEEGPRHRINATDRDELVTIFQDFLNDLTP